MDKGPTVSSKETRTATTRVRGGGTRYRSETKMIMSDGQVAFVTGSPKDTESEAMTDALNKAAKAAREWRTTGKRPGRAPVHSTLF